MAAAVPKTASSSLLQDIGDAQRNNLNRVIQGLPEDIFTLERLRRDAEALTRADPRGAYMALAALATVDFDVPMMRQYFAQARNAPGLVSHEIVISNFAIALQRMGIYVEAAKVALEASDLVPEDLELLRRAIRFALFAGDIEQAILLGERFMQRGGQPEHHLVGTPAKVLGVLEKTGVPREEYAKGQELLFDLLREDRIHHTKITIGTRDEVEENEVSYIVSVVASQEQALDLGDRLADRLVEDIADWHPWIMVFDFRCAEVIQ